MTQGNPSPAASVSVVYHSAEDRLLFVVTGADNLKRAIMVTRRLTIRLIDGFAHLLDRTSSAAQEAPEWARSDMIMFEHQGALAKVQAPSAASVTAPGAVTQKKPMSDTVAGAGSAAKTPPLPILMDAVDIKIKPKSFLLTLKSGGQAVSHMEVGRGDLHRFLALLRRKCDEADWRVVNQTKWLDLDAGSMTLN